MYEYEAYMRCRYCGTRVVQRLGAHEVKSKRGNRRRHCDYCMGPTEWEFLSWKGPPPPEAAEISGEMAIPHRLLMIDDDDLTVAMLRKLFDGDECVLDAVHDGKEALEKLKDQNYSLIVCDIHMPNLDGKELFRIVEEQGLEARKSILFLTGDTSEATRTFLEQTGCPYMYKPIQILQFASTVREILADVAATRVSSDSDASPDAEE